MNVWERLHQLRGILYTHCQSIILSVPAFKPIEKLRLVDSGEIRIEGIKFIDESILNFFEDIHLGNIEKYSYEYIQHNGFFFVYENEGIQNGIKKPLYHLHVGIMRENADEILLQCLPEKLIEHKGPHFKAPKMNFHEFMGIIIANFFAEDEDECKKILKGLGLVKEKEPRF